jgi:anti-sigma factor RsiW
MNCHSFINVLDLFSEGRLSARRAGAVEKHLAACPSCRALVAPVPRAASGASAPASLKERLLAAAKAVPSEPVPAAAPRLDLPLWPREARGLALAAAALLVVGLLIAATGVPSQSGGSIAAVEEP